MQYKKVRQLKPVEKGYVAGILDGEGTVTLSIKQKGGTEHLAVYVSNTELSLMKYLIAVVGAGKITRKLPAKTNHSVAYTYALYNQQALVLLRQVVPCMLTYKAGRGKLALKSYSEVTPRNGKYTPAQIHKRKIFVRTLMGILPDTKKTA